MPDCGGRDVTPTLTTTAGAYCQCGTCRHLWHEERRKNENGAIKGGRRRTDQPLS